MNFNPFEAGRGLSTYYAVAFDDLTVFQSLWNRAGSFDENEFNFTIRIAVFQSLWSRAGLSTAKRTPYLARVNVSIPLAQGGSFDSLIANLMLGQGCFNPFGAGRGLSTFISLETPTGMDCLNPFGTGRGLSTSVKTIIKTQPCGLNPFGTGQGLSTAEVVWCLDG